MQLRFPWMTLPLALCCTCILSSCEFVGAQLADYEKSKASSAEYKKKTKGAFARLSQFNKQVAMPSSPFLQSYSTLLATLCANSPEAQGPSCHLALACS